MWSWVSELLHPWVSWPEIPCPPHPSATHTLNLVTSRICLSRKSLTSPLLTTASFISYSSCPGYHHFHLPSTPSRPLTPWTCHFPCCLDLILDPIRVHCYCLCLSLANAFSTLSSATSARKAPALLLFSRSTSVFMPNCLEKFTHMWGPHKFMGSNFSQTLSTRESCLNN